MIQIPSILPADNEVTLMRENFYEASLQRGHLSHIRQVESRDLDQSNDAKYVHKDPVDVHIFFEEYPKRQVLSQLGWLSDLSENQPIAHIPTFYYSPEGEKVPLKPVKGTKITFGYDTLDGTDGNDDRTFSVSHLAADNIRITHWIVMLVPERTADDFEDAPAVDDDFTYLNITNERPMGR